MTVAARSPESPRRRLPLAPLLVVLPLVLAAGIYSLAKLSHVADRVEHVQQLRMSLGQLLSTAIDIETGCRGYVVAGEPRFLQPYHRGMSAWPSQLAQIRKLTDDDAGQRARVDHLAQLLATRIELSKRLLATYDAGHRAGELTSLMLEGKRVMDELRVATDELDQQQAQLDELHRREESRRWLWTLLLFIGAAFSFLIVLTVAWAQRREADARRERAEEVSRASELFRIVLAGVDMGITVQDSRGALIYANEAGARIIGFSSPVELLAASASEVMARFEVFRFDGTAFPVEQLPSRAALEGHVSDEMSLRFRVRGSREERWAILRAVPVRDPAGRVVSVLNFFREVTDSMREQQQRAFLLSATDELSSSLDYEKTLAAVARLAVPVLADWCAVDLVDGDRTRRVATAHVDPAKVRLVEELERRYPGDPRAATGVSQIVRSGQAEMMAEIPGELLRAAAVDAEHLRLIEELRLGSYIGVPLSVGDRTIGALTFAMAESDRRYGPRDLEFARGIADRAALAIDNARLYQEVERARATVAAQLDAETARRRDAEESASFASMFIGILGHDLRNPLNAVSMAASLIKRRGGAEADSRVIDRILSSVSRMSNMVGQLLDLTRSRLAGGIPIDKQSSDLAAVVAAVVDELRLAHPEREMPCVRPDELVGLWDSNRLAQVFSNLVGNALEHGDPARPVAVALFGDEADVKLVVHSDGKPIPPELLPVIFEPYRRNTVRGARSKGLGLGLFISQQIVHAHGGRIDVASTAEEGTTFTVTLPWARER